VGFFMRNGPTFATQDGGNQQGETMQTINRVQPLMHERKGALGWALLVWLLGGGLGVALLVFVVLMMMGG